MESNCIFCKIVSGQIPAKKILQNDHAVVIADLHPQAAKHFLIIPKDHIESVDTAFQDPAHAKFILGELFSLGRELALQEGLLPGGFRSVINTNADGGQTVFHLHLHILGGEKLKGSFA
jgi:histidine triad (HIT) family protein